MRWLKWSEDKWLSTQGTVLKHDKLEHFFGSAGLALFFNPWVVIGLGIAWEIKDGLMKWEKFGWWGGEGVSWKDLVADISGVALAITIITFLL